MIGKTLGHYQIIDLIGKGGMGEVYRAKDQKLGRDVAIKVLPEEFAKDTDRVARFQREAKLLASLNHPNIAAIHGLEECSGINFLVLELVEGDTLADRIKAGAIPVEESLDLALQMAEALESAHGRGVIHRDLKPANIKVTGEGKVKVLDFGLAKAFAGEQSELSNSPTISYAATQQGVILGTAPYMSPEQARGKSVDKRADIWAFGCVLYEMLTGQAAFQGEDVTEVLAAVVKLGANLELLPAYLHPRVRDAIGSCLEKDLKKRFRDIGDVKLEIEKARMDRGGVSFQTAAAAKPRSRLKASLPWIAALILAMVTVGLVVWSFRAPGPPQVISFSDELPKGRQFYSPTEPAIAVSPTGNQLVYSTNKGLYLRPLGEMDAKLIPGTEDESIWYPFFSPDGRWIAYWSQQNCELRKMPISGGASATVCNTSRLFGGASWDFDDTMVFSDLGGGCIMRVSANGGTPEYVVKGRSGTELYFLFPQLLPDRKSVLFTKIVEQRDSMKAHIMVKTPGSEEPRELFEGYQARYLPTGHMAYMVGTNILGLGGHNLFAVPFSLDKFKATGEPVPMVQNIRGPWGVHYTISKSGTLAYRPGKSGAVVTGQTLLWVDGEGKETPIQSQPRIYGNPKVSPDGDKVAVTIQESGGNADIWALDLLRGTLTRLTFDGRWNYSPVWFANGKKIAFTSMSRGGTFKKAGVYLTSADGTGGDEPLSFLDQLGRSFYAACFSKSGKDLVGTETLGSGVSDIAMLSTEGNHKRTALLQGDYLESQPQVSPDGRWIAYISDESHKNEVYVRSFPDVENGERWQVSTNGGESPLWSPKGNELFYRRGDDVMAVSIKMDTGFDVIGTPRPLFHGPYAAQWDISRPDGKRFLMMKPAGTRGEDTGAEGSEKINIVLNWLEELKQRAPAR